MLLSQEEVCPAAVSPSAVLREQEMRAVSLRDTHIEWAQRDRLSTAVSDFCDAGRSVPICDSSLPKKPVRGARESVGAEGSGDRES